MKAFEYVVCIVLRVMWYFYFDLQKIIATPIQLIQ